MTKPNSAPISDTLPELEKPCLPCRGHGGSPGYPVCRHCAGAGTIPTEFGERVWAFVQRRLLSPPTTAALLALIARRLDTSQK